MDKSMGLGTAGPFSDIVCMMAAKATCAVSLTAAGSELRKRAKAFRIHIEGAVRTYLNDPKLYKLVQGMFYKRKADFRTDLTAPLTNDFVTHTARHVHLLF